jgi:branched-subunit amino acid aminotransferase/4-amino-4-deoxychorismate lyase
MKYCYLNGEVLPEHEAKVGILDIGLLRGFGIYEAMTTVGDKVFMIDDHLARFRRSAEFMNVDVPISDEEIKRVISELVQKNGFVRSNIKFILTGGEAIGGICYNPATPTFYMFLEEWKTIDESNYSHGSHIIIHEFLRDYPEYKTTNYITAVRLQNDMRKAQAIETLYTWQGKVLECATSNFFIIKNNVLVTPTDSVLHGITRNVTIDVSRKVGLDIEEREVTVEEMYGADECFLTSSFKDVVPVVQVGDATIGDGKVGQTTQKVMQLFKAFKAQY